jgi:hypothetical protein
MVIGAPLEDLYNPFGPFSGDAVPGPAPVRANLAQKVVLVAGGR